MESKLENLYRSMILLQAMNFKRPQRIKVKTDFYNYLIVKYKSDTYFVKSYEGSLAYFTGVPIIVDDTIDNYYELEF